MTIRIDAHQHFWNLERIHYPILSPEVFGELCRTIEPAELDPLRRKAGFDKTIVVQAKDGIDESRYLLELAEQHEWIAGVVGWVDLAEPELAEKQLQELGSHEKFIGVRHLIMVESDPEWLIRPRVLEGLRILAEHNLPFEVGAEFPLHLKHVVTLANEVPKLRMVIDHLAKPPVAANELTEWQEQMREAASYPEVYAKISGLQPEHDLRTIISFALDAFGAERLMFGSDWPLCTFNRSYEDVKEDVENAIQDWQDDERAQLFGLTAQRVYRLARRRSPVNYTGLRSEFN